MEIPESLPYQYKALCRLLRMKRDYFQRRNKLGADGSFFCSDVQLAETMGCCPKTIVRARKRLEKEGFILYKPGSYIGDSTRYWLTPKGDILTSFVSSKRGTFCFKEPDSLSSRAPHSVLPINNNDLKEIEQLYLPKSCFEMTLFECKQDLAKTKERLLRAGYTLAQIDEFVFNLNNSNLERKDEKESLPP